MPIHMHVCIYRHAYIYIYIYIHIYILMRERDIVIVCHLQVPSNKVHTHRLMMLPQFSTSSYV